MKIRISILTFLFVSSISMAGCQDLKRSKMIRANQALPVKIQKKMKALDMPKNSPILIRLFKEESMLEVWKQKRDGKYGLIAEYNICKWSGKLGPKYVEGDRQAPEGFYTVSPAQMNPYSNYYLAFDIGFPNAYDRAHGRTGRHLMVHGSCSSSGCYSMTDKSIAQIYAFGRDSFLGRHPEFQVHAFPFRMTAHNIIRYRKDPNYPFWAMLKEGYDIFETTRILPKIDVCYGRYVFNGSGGPCSPS
ncbi:MAG: porphobilinogen synthase [Candidatus Tokpelaia sp. JSC189]|nr:MAG: porphobilinogen synthase [Candidatus Tokpelaia sp. JSC189]